MTKHLLIRYSSFMRADVLCHYLVLKVSIQQAFYLERIASESTVMIGTVRDYEIDCVPDMRMLGPALKGNVHFHLTHHAENFLVSSNYS